MILNPILVLAFLHYLLDLRILVLLSCFIVPLFYSSYIPRAINNMQLTSNFAFFGNNNCL